jgi:hypothetical protein
MVRLKDVGCWSEVVPVGLCSMSLVLWGRTREKRETVLAIWTKMLATLKMSPGLA